MYSVSHLVGTGPKARNVYDAMIVEETVASLQSPYERNEKPHILHLQITYRGERPMLFLALLYLKKSSQRSVPQSPATNYSVLEQDLEHPYQTTHFPIGMKQLSPCYTRKNSACLSNLGLWSIFQPFKT